MKTITRTAIAALLAMSITTGTLAHESVACYQLGSTRAYISTLFQRDSAGDFDMDYQNDYLSDVPLRCRPLVLGFGKLIAKEYNFAR